MKNTVTAFFHLVSSIRHQYTYEAPPQTDKIQSQRKNTKFEYQNTKQIRMTKNQML